MKQYYEARIEILENHLEQKIAELRTERECNKEAIRYILYLIGLLGGRVEIDLHELSMQEGEIKCLIKKNKDELVLWAGRKDKQFMKNKEEKRCLISLENLTPMKN